MPEIKVNLHDLIKKSIVQIKYEEIGSWLATHRIPLFYAHKGGFTVVDQKYIDDHPDLKKALDKLVKNIEKKQKQPQKPAKSKTNTTTEPITYIG